MGVHGIVVTKEITPHGTTPKLKMEGHFEFSKEKLP